VLRLILKGNDLGHPQAGRRLIGGQQRRSRFSAGGNQLCRDTIRAIRDHPNPLRDFATAALCFSRQRSYVFQCMRGGLSGNPKPDRSPPNRAWIFRARHWPRRPLHSSSDW